MRYFKFICFIYTFISIVACAKPGIPNWDGISWNSPIDTIKSKYGEKLFNPGKTKHWGSGEYSDYVINDYKYMGEKFAATFVMDSISNGLKRVDLSLKDSMSDYDFETFEAIYSSLKNTLAQKYGNADTNGFVAKYGMRNGFAKWFFDSTTLEISSIFSNELKTKIIDICFEESPLALRVKKEKWRFVDTHNIEFDIRRVQWGYTKEQVKASENDAPIEDSNDVIAYATTIAGMQCTIRYEFIDDMLAKAKYMIREDHTNKNDCIVDYTALKSHVSKKHGKPGMDLDEQWKDEFYTDDPQNYGHDISMGHLYYLSCWQLPKTGISLMLSGGNHEITLVLEFTSKKYENNEIIKNDSSAINIHLE